MKKIITALQEPPVVNPIPTIKPVTVTTMITPPSVVASAPATEGKITHLLQECQTHYQANRLTTGAPGTAFDCYQTVLQLDPNNRQALNGLNNIQNRYLGWIESAIQQNNLNKANVYLASLQKINPQLPALAQLKRRLKSTTTSQKSSSPILVKESTPTHANQSSLSSPKIASSPPVLEPLPKKKNTTCEGCNCSELLKQLSMGVKPLTSVQSSFFRNQCR
ncbi:MAG: tetratricopeptide repeat protein [Thioploca sp.]|nr:tetratricopeptide repeat protein [Thioploca sp.]